LPLCMWVAGPAAPGAGGSGRSPPAPAAETWSRRQRTQQTPWAAIIQLGSWALQALVPAWRSEFCGCYREDEWVILLLSLGFTGILSGRKL